MARFAGGLVLFSFLCGAYINNRKNCVICARDWTVLTEELGKNIYILYGMGMVWYGMVWHGMER